jgi:predicted ATPase/class 3 adenylate cyclase
MLPSGTITFLFTDIEGSTRLWEQQPEAMREALARHDGLLRHALTASGGHIFKTVGDQFCAAFSTTAEALGAALAAQQALLNEPWPELGPLRVRMALHTGAAELRDADYFGPAVNRVARLLALAHGGQILLSHASYELVRDTLSEDAALRDLGLYRLKDLQRPEQVYQLLHPSLVPDFPPLNSLDAHPHNLPLQLTRFIGREAEMAAVKELLGRTGSGPPADLREMPAIGNGRPTRSDTGWARTPEVGNGDGPRLLTLTGAGGCGKTRLALQAAADLVEQYPDGVWLVELAALADPLLVPQAVATTFRLREEPGRPHLESLVAALRSRSLLLLLDNCEHVVTACAQLSTALLRECPRLQILATSREALRVGGETVWRVPSLSLPDLPTLSAPHAPDGSASTVAPPGLASAREPRADPGNVADAFTQSEAVRLFIDRALSNEPEFEVTNENAPWVAQICRQLEGIPLAIELAAARVKVLSVEQIAVRLDDRFRLLTGGSREALPRQQTLRAAMDWSHELLSQEERILLRRLSVFAGGFTLAAAETVCAGPALHVSHIVELIGKLVDRSLVVVETTNVPESRHSGVPGETSARPENPNNQPPENPDAEPRYRLLETVRQYAAGHLWEEGETPLFRQRHRDWFLELGEQAEAALAGPQQEEWLARLEQEHDNLRAALDRSLERGVAEGGKRWLGALAERWWVRGSLRTALRGWAIGDDTALGLRLAGALEPFWLRRGYWAEGRERLTALLALAGLAPRILTSHQRGRDGEGMVRAETFDTHAAGTRFSRRYGRIGNWALVSLVLLPQVHVVRVALLGVPLLGREWLLMRWEYGVSFSTYLIFAVLWVKGWRGSRPFRKLKSSWAMREGWWHHAERWLFEAMPPSWLLAASCVGPLLCLSVFASLLVGASPRTYHPRPTEAVIAASYLVGSLWFLAVLQNELLAKWLARTSAPRSAALARALRAAGRLAAAQGELAAGEALYEESLDLYRLLGETQEVAVLFQDLGELAREQGRSAWAQMLHETSLLVALKRRDRSSVALSLDHLGSTALYQSKIDAAHAYYDESRAICQQLGDQEGVARALYGLGSVELARGPHEEVQARATASLSPLSSGKPCEEARRCYLESMAIRRALGNKEGMAACLEGLAAADEGMGQPERAVRLFAAAEALRQALGAVLSPPERADHDRLVAAARAVLGEPVFASAWTEGRALPLEQAIEEAAEDLANQPAPAALTAVPLRSLIPRRSAAPRFVLVAVRWAGRAVGRLRRELRAR